MPGWITDATLTCISFVLCCMVLAACGGGVVAILHWLQPFASWWPQQGPGYSRLPRGGNFTLATAVCLNNGNL